MRSLRGLGLAAAAALGLGAGGLALAQDIDPLAELAALGDSLSDAGPEGGGSIRAKREVDPSIAKRKTDKRNLEARVEDVRTGKFPAVAVKLKVLKPAQDGAGKGLSRNATLVVLPQLKVAGGKVDMGDEPTRLNAGAFYLQSGDRVVVRIGDNKKGDLWTAEYIERK